MDKRTIRSSEDLKGLRQERLVKIDRDAIDEDKRTVRMAFATETPVERYFGFEILDCKPKSVRMGRLNAHAPILVQHDPDDHVGVVESATMDKDKIGRVISRYSRSERGQEIFQDIVDGIRANTSVGYMIHEAVLEKEEEGVRTYRVTDWEPYEVSIVSMPADINCGVGRQADINPQSKEHRAMNKCTHCGVDLAEGTKCNCSGARLAEAELARRNNDTYEIEQAEKRALEKEQNRVKLIMDAGDKYVSRGGREISMRLIQDPQATVEDFNVQMLARIEKESRAAIITRPLPAGSIEVNPRYNKDSLRAFMRYGEKAAENAFRAGKWCRAVIWGDRDANRWCTDYGVRIMTEGSGSAGGFTVPDELEMPITDLRVEYGAARALCRIIPMGSAATPVPVRTGGVTAYFIGETGSGTPSDMTWGLANLVAKDLNAETRISNNLAEDSEIDIAAQVADEHAQAFAAKEDACMVVGDGTSTYGGIRGLNTLFEAAYSTLKGCYACATNSDSPQEVIAGELAGLMGKLPRYARRGAYFLSSGEFDVSIYDRLMAAAGGNTTQTLAGEIAPRYLGKPREVNEYMPSDSTADLSNKVITLYGDFKKACLLGDRRGIRIRVLTEVLAQSNQIVILGTERFDFNCEYAIGDANTAGSVVALIGG